MGYVLHVTDEETQAFKKVYISCSNVVNNFAERITYLSLLGTNYTMKRLFLTATFLSFICLAIVF